MYMDNKIQNAINRFTDIYRESTINYWNMLLSANTIIISVFSGISILSDFKIIPIIIVVFSMISSFLLIQNSRIVKNMYQIIGEKSMQEKPTEDIAKKDIGDAVKKNKEIKKRERIIEFILLFEALLILLAIFNGLLNNYTKQVYSDSKSPICNVKNFCNKFHKY